MRFWKKKPKSTEAPAGKKRFHFLRILVRATRIIGTALRFLFLFVAALAVAVLIAVSQIDPNQYRGEIEETISNITRREVEISGNIEWRVFSLEPGFKVGSISVKNPAWAEEPYIFSSSNAEAIVSLRKLIMEQRIAIETLRLNNSIIRLEISKSGKKNWLPDSEGASSGGDIGMAGIENVEIRNADAKFFDARDGESREVQVKRLSVRAPSVERMKFGFSAVYEGVAYGFDGTGQLIDGEFLVNGQGRLNNALIGVMARAKTGENDKRVFSAKLDFFAPSLSGALAGFADWDNLSGPIAASADAVFSDGFVSIPRLQLSYSNLDISADADVNLKGRRPDIRANLSAPLLDIPTVFYPGWEAAYRERVKKGIEAPSDGRPRPVHPKAFRDVELPVEELMQANLNIHAYVDKLKAMPDMELSNVSARIMLVDGHGAVAPVSFEMAGGGGEVSIIADNSNSTFNADVSIKADDVEVGSVVDSTGHAGVFKNGRAQADIKLFSHGRNLEEFMAGLNGYAKVYTTSRMTGYRIERVFMAEDLFSSVVRTLTGRRGADKESRISCAVVNLRIQDGVARSNRGVAIETDAANVVIDGSVDFAKETMDVSIITLVKEGMKISNSLTDLIRIEGAMARPKIILAGEGLVTNLTRTALATALVGMMTGGISIVVAGIGYVTQIWLSNITQDESPCVTAFEGSANPRPEEAFTEQIQLRSDMDLRIGEKTDELDQITTRNIDKARSAAAKK